MTAHVVTNTCPACGAGDNVQARVYQYARVFLCGAHRATWDAADDRQHTKEGACPHRPARCPRALCDPINEEHTQDQGCWCGGGCDSLNY